MLHFGFMCLLLFFITTLLSLFKTPFVRKIGWKIPYSEFDLFFFVMSLTCSSSSPTSRKQHRLRGLLRFRINYFVQEFFMGNAVYFLLHHDLRHMVPRSLIYGGPKISEWVQVRSVWSLYYKVPHSPFIEWF